jgi:hypothetical protein
MNCIMMTVEAEDGTTETTPGATRAPRTRYGASRGNSRRRASTIALRTLA